MDYKADLAGALEKNRAARDAQQENQARYARCELTWTTLGIGEANTGKAIAFKLRFIEEPTFTSGFALDPSTDLVDKHYPRVSCGVYEWQLDNKKCYIGALLFFTVDTIGPGAVLGTEPNYQIHHHLKFEGKAVKDLPDYLLDL